ncbi:ABC transporter ATP-binding protein [Oligella urethralis]|uniref:ABC transporter ATP-binding protein n=1 Tax=Oligella urethralis TaxID=90245 RepID=UPI000CFE8FF3|nr:ABC transporter ATP-binding protein [Oligella urethralis]AVL70897.1 ABC transporter ATP-binding protein [Oligella urethralis]
MSRVCILQSKGLHVKFGGVKAANDVNLNLYEGELASIIGPNGSGKTTFLNLCTGYVRPNEGEVIFKDKDLTKMPPRDITRLGAVRTFQLPQLFTENTVIQNILIALAARTGFWSLRWLDRPSLRDEAMEILSVFGLKTESNRYIHSLPEGVRKLVDIAVSMALSPTLLLMDEPTSGVSSDEKFEIMDILIPILRERKITALLVEHDMELVERYMDRVIVWNAGQVMADGEPSTILRDERVINEVIGVVK